MNDRPMIRSSRRGMALVQGMLLVLVLSILGVALLSTAIANSKMSNRRALRTRALHLAQSGLDEAIVQFRYNADFLANGGSRTYTLDSERRFTITRTDRTDKDAKGNNVTIRQVTAVGTVTPGSGTAVSATLRVNVGAQGGNGVLDFTIASKKTLDLSGNNQVNSVPNKSVVPNAPASPSSGVLTNAATVHSNVDVEFGGSAYVGGNASASGQVVGESGHLSGTAVDDAEEIWFPPITQAMKDAALVDGSTAGNITINGGTIKGKYSGNVTIDDGGATMTTGKTVWIVGNLSMTGPVSGEGVMIVDGTVELDKGNTDIVGGNVIFMVTNTSTTAVTLKGNQTFAGRFYVPDGGVKFNGNPNFIGTVAANEVDLKGNPSIYRDVSSDVPANSLPKFLESKGWEELARARRPRPRRPLVIVQRPGGRAVLLPRAG